MGPNSVAFAGHAFGATALLAHGTGYRKVNALSYLRMHMTLVVPHGILRTHLTEKVALMINILDTDVQCELIKRQQS